jgi:hypothetical protein
MRGRSAFKQRDVTRATKAVIAAGLEVARVVIRDGEIAVIPGKPSEKSAAEAALNEWDEVVPDVANKKRSS